jgi:UDP-N-acetylglucosamine/UDP-N-acetylgalactosamine diphosphorylase
MKLRIVRVENQLDKENKKMTYEQAEKLLKKNSQEHILAHWKKLSASSRKALLAQIETIDFKDVKRCQEVLKSGDAVSVKKGKPVAPKVAELKGASLKKAILAGEKELASGHVGVLLVAGGQGSRLGFEGPKGAYSIGPITGSSLFNFHARKVLALSFRYSVNVPFYIMTSEANYNATVEHFEENDYFGLNPDDVIFFKQGMWPGMTSDGKIILDRPDHIFMSPDGHGGVISALKANGCFADMRKRGVNTIFFFQVDNPLVEVADPAFIGYHTLNKSEYSLKLCAKREPSEGLGMVVKRDGHFEIIEYTEMTDEMNNRRTKSGDLYFKYGSPAIHVFDREFLEREAASAMPLHLAHKKIPYVNEKGEVVKPSEPNGYKFEKFIFDSLCDAKSVALMAFDRNEEFSPVKNAEGKDSPASCRADLQAKWRRQLSEAGITVPDGLLLEIDPVYALDSADIKATGLLLEAGI